MVTNKLPDIFGINFKGMSREEITYCIFLLHAFGLTWNSGHKYEYTKEIVSRINIGSVQRRSQENFHWNPDSTPSTIQVLSLNDLENTFKKLVSKHQIEPFDYGQVMSYKERFLQGE